MDFFHFLCKTPLPIIVLYTGIDVSICIYICKYIGSSIYKFIHRSVCISLCKYVYEYLTLCYFCYKKSIWTERGHFWILFSKFLALSKIPFCICTWNFFIFVLSKVVTVSSTFHFCSGYIIILVSSGEKESVTSQNKSECD